jgi:hypothetical protein
MPLLPLAQLEALEHLRSFLSVTWEKDRTGAAFTLASHEASMSCKDGRTRFRPAA